MPLPIIVPACVAALVLIGHDNFKRPIGKKTLKTFINIFMLFQLPPFIHNVNLSIT